MMDDSTRKVGSLEMALPWREGEPSLPNNRKVAEKRLRSLQSRLKNDHNLRERYKKAIEEYIEKSTYKNFYIDDCLKSQSSVDPIKRLVR